MSDRNVLPKRPRPTRTAYREAVAKVIRRLKAEHHLTNVKLAERIGADAESVPNWENELTTMDPILLLCIEDEFGSGSIDPVTEIAGSHLVPLDVEASGDALPPLSSCVHRIAAARAASSPGGPSETRDELLAMEADLIEARRNLNRMLARVKRLKGS